MDIKQNPYVAYQEGAYIKVKNLMVQIGYWLVEISTIYRKYMAHIPI